MALIPTSLTNKCAVFMVQQKLYTISGKTAHTYLATPCAAFISHRVLRGMQEKASCTFKTQRQTSKKMFDTALKFNIVCTLILETASCIRFAIAQCVTYKRVKVAQHPVFL